MTKSSQGLFITFEGSEGSGKTTQIERVRADLERRRCPVLFVREPGGVAISEQIRNILLDVKNSGMTDTCETLLYMAARAQLVAEVIAPALKEGKVVLCDRFLDSTLVYQGYGNGVDLDWIRSVGRLVTQGIAPDLTVIFDIDAGEGLQRIDREKDRIEQRPLDYHTRVRRGYQELAAQDPQRIKLIAVTNRSRDDIAAEVGGYVGEILEKGLKDQRIKGLK